MRTLWHIVTGVRGREVMFLSSVYNRMHTGWIWHLKCSNIARLQMSYISITFAFAFTYLHLHLHLHILMLQEVRLSSSGMRKLHSECDFKQLSSGNYVAVTPCRPRLSLDDVNGELGGPSLRALCSPQCCAKPSVIDKYSRVFFPLSFVGFNLLYWVTYLNVSGMNEEQDIVLME